MQTAGIFVVGTDTEVGKTYQCVEFARALTPSRSVGVYKPVASGGSGESGDPQVLSKAVDAKWPIERICPQVFQAPVAPPVAAGLESREVDEQLLREGAEWFEGRCDYLIIEGAGGVLSPISNSTTVLDLAESLQLPIALVAANKLGVVNHTLLSITAIESRGLQLSAIVLNSWDAFQDPSQLSNKSLLKQFTQIPILGSLVELAEDL